MKKKKNWLEQLLNLANHDVEIAINHRKKGLNETFKIQNNMPAKNQDFRSNAYSTYPVTKHTKGKPCFKNLQKMVISPPVRYFH